jgi:hypothetical protein
MLKIRSIMTNSELLCAETETKLLFPHMLAYIKRGCAAHKVYSVCVEHADSHTE